MDGTFFLLGPPLRMVTFWKRGNGWGGGGIERVAFAMRSSSSHHGEIGPGGHFFFGGCREGTTVRCFISACRRLRATDGRTFESIAQRLNLLQACPYNLARIKKKMETESSVCWNMTCDDITTTDSPPRNIYFSHIHFEDMFCEEK